MTPEERAGALLMRYPSAVPPIWSDLQRDIAAAIRDAVAEAMAPWKEQEQNIWAERDSYYGLVAEINVLHALALESEKRFGRGHRKSERTRL